MKVLIRHGWNEELLVIEVVEHCNFHEGPVTRIRIKFISTPPNLQLLIHHPDAVVLKVVGNAVAEVDDGLVLVVIIHLASSFPLTLRSFKSCLFSSSVSRPVSFAVGVEVVLSFSALVS